VIVDRGDAGDVHAGRCSGEHREDGEEDEEDESGHCFTASASAWCSRMRHEGPLMLNTTARCTRRSRIAETTASPNASPRAGSPRLVVARVG
jgi:hypothetical protein